MAEWLNVTPAVFATVCGIFGLLAVASTATASLRHFRPELDWTELTQRVRTWWMMVAVFTTALFVGKTLSLAFFGLISFLALKEFFSLIPTRRVDRRVLFWAYLAIPIQYGLIGVGWYEAAIIFVPVYVFLFVPFRMVLHGETDGFLRAAGTIHWGVMLTVFCVSHAAQCLVLSPPEGLETQAQVGPGFLLLLVLLTQGNDVAQYVWGKSLGTRKIVPKVSPGKTWGGFLGGVATTTALGGLLGPILTPMSLPLSLTAGALIAVAGFIGDLTVSSLKRDLKIKDTGAMLPGHGGLLDRIDSLTYTAPLFFHLVFWQMY